MDKEQFAPHHINAESGDFEGNGGHGRYVILPGSDGRAEKIASLWNNVEVKKHPRNHNLYLGTMPMESGDIDMAVVSTGMGAPSADIVISELINLGARNLIRVGTAGSLQPGYVRAGSIVVPTGSVKDESTTSRYLPSEMPAVPSIEFLMAAYAAKERMNCPVYFGVVHSKDSLYAREMLAGPRRRENKEYMQLLKAGGVLASEMETSILFTLGQVYSQENKKKGGVSILTGAVLAVIGDSVPFGGKDIETATIDASISFCMKTIEILNNKRSLDL